MSFAIYRTAKLKSMGEIGGSLSHTYRTRPTPNADENKLHLNKHIFETYNQCFDALKNAIPEKRRSNAVLCVEHLITASPDWNGWGTEKESEFFKKSVEFLNKKYGKENVIACSIHRDETTPHLIVYIVPIDEKGGLNAKKWLGGRSKLSQTQTEFANEVKHFGLERGLENSKARHKTIKQFYAEIEKPTPKLKNKNALITGAGKGIGKAIALALAKEGVNVILVARTQEEIDIVATKARSLRVKALAITADVADINSVNTAVEKALKEFGTIDILINNAGIAAFGKFLELEPTDWERIIQVNLMGTYYVTRAVLPKMIERQTGDIINISSTAGLNGNAMTSAYSASKFAVLGLTDSLMQEVRKHNIRVTALTPSTVATNMAKDLNLTDGNPDKVMQAEDMAELIIAQLKLNRRVFIKNSSIWSTNP